MGNTNIVTTDSKISPIAHDKRAEYTVHGYLHRIQRESKFQNTPSLILFTCLKYARDWDNFSTNTDHISMTNDNKTITKTNVSGKKRKKWHFAVGNTVIDTNKHLIAKWILTVNKCVKRELGIVFGLHDAIGEWVFVSIYNLRGVCHCFEEFETMKAKRVRKKSMRFGEGDEIKVILDTKTERMKFSKGNGKEVVLFKRNSTWSSGKFLKSQCRFAVGLYELGNSVTITHFEMVYY